MYKLHHNLYHSVELIYILTVCVIYWISTPAPISSKMSHYPLSIYGQGMKGAERVLSCQDQSRVSAAGGVIRVIESWIISQAEQIR